MTLRMDDFKCLDCSHEFEELWDRRESQNDWCNEVHCPECGSECLEKILASPGLGEFSMKDKQGRTESLKKRSLDHSKKLMKQDMDKHRARIKRKMNAIQK